MTRTIDLSGAYTALITPFTADGGTVDVAALARAVARQAAGGMTGVVPCGTTGETPTLTADEQATVIATTIEAARPHGLRVIAGAGGNDTRTAIERHRDAAAAGADAALHVTPYYNKPSAEGVRRHFLAIADACELPIVLYNVPGRTGVRLDIETIQTLARHPHIVAMKEASGDLGLAADIATRTDLLVLGGDDPLTVPLALNGARGVISVASNLVPERIAWMWDAAARGDWTEAVRRHRELLPIARALLELDTNPVPIKTAMHIAGLDTGTVRLPLAPAPDAVVQPLRRLLASIGLGPDRADRPIVETRPVIKATR